ncbi:unnamed protein product [Amoebophrya sp. A120]|nr:unnamed protein product [Amoebophrya sp. A120]|eukprot:GSA120T00012593001.1
MTFFPVVLAQPPCNHGKHFLFPSRSQVIQHPRLQVAYAVQTNFTDYKPKPIQLNSLPTRFSLVNDNDDPSAHLPPIVKLTSATTNAGNAPNLLTNLHPQPHTINTGDDEIDANLHTIHGVGMAARENNLMQFRASLEKAQGISDHHAHHTIRTSISQMSSQHHLIPLHEQITKGSKGSKPVSAEMERMSEATRGTLSGKSMYDWEKSTGDTDIVTRLFQANDSDRDGNITWNKGEITAFAKLVFDAYDVPIPALTNTQWYLLYKEFDEEDRYKLTLKEAMKMAQFIHTKQVNNDMDFANALIPASYRGASVGTQQKVAQELGDVAVGRVV